MPQYILIQTKDFPALALTQAALTIAEGSTENQHSTGRRNFALVHAKRTPTRTIKHFYTLQAELRWKTYAGAPIRLKKNGAAITNTHLHRRHKHVVEEARISPQSAEQYLCVEQYL